MKKRLGKTREKKRTFENQGLFHTRTQLYFFRLNLSYKLLRMNLDKFLPENKNFSKTISRVEEWTENIFENADVIEGQRCVYKYIRVSVDRK